MKMEKFIIVTLGGFLSWIIGGWSILLTVLFILNFLDYVTGVSAAWGNIQSKIFIKGISKKGLMWIWIVVANLIDIVLKHQGLEFGGILTDSVVLLFIITEITSLSENSVKLGFKVPAPIEKALGFLSGKNENEKGDGK